MWGDWLPLRSNPSRGSYIDAGRCTDREDLISSTGSVSASWPFGSGEEHSDEDERWGRDNPACWMMLRSSLFSRTRFWTYKKWKMHRMQLFSNTSIISKTLCLNFSHTKSKHCNHKTYSHFQNMNTKTVYTLQYENFDPQRKVAKHTLPILWYQTKLHTPMNTLCVCTTSKIR
jgi:hypothetical protein